MVVTRDAKTRTASTSDLDSGSGGNANPENHDPPLGANAANALPPPPVHPPSGELERLRDRKSARTRATQLSTDIEQYRNRTDSGRDPALLSWKIAQCEECLDQLLKIKINAPDPEPSDHVEKLMREIHCAKYNLAKWEREPAKQQVEPSPSSASSSLNDASYYNSVRLSAPIPTFGGSDSCSWAQFWGLFSADVGDDPRIPPAKKFVHLLSHLDGTAASAIAGLLPTAENYKVAVDILKSRFDRPDVRKDFLIRRILEVKPLPASAKSEERRRFVDNLVSSLRELQTLGMSPGEATTIVLPVLVPRLPDDWRLRWLTLSEDNRCQQLSDLISFLEKHIGIMEKNECLSASRVESAKPPRPPPPFPTGGVSAMLAVNANPHSSNSRPSGKTPCPACKGPAHSLSHCQEFRQMNPRAKSDAVRQAKLCFSCLGPHLLAKCRSQMTCRNCSGRHNTLLCKRQENQGQNLRQPQPNFAQNFAPVQPNFVHNIAPAQPNFVPNSAPRQPPALTMGANTSSAPVIQGMQSVSAGSLPSSTYMKTAICMANGPLGSRAVRIFIDDGANVSFISTTVSRELGLPTTSTAVFACAGWRGLIDAASSRRQVSCTLKSFFTGNEVPCLLWEQDGPLCAAQRSRRVPVTPLLHGLPIADDFRAGLVDIMIGADLMYDIVGEQHIQISPSLRAIETAFGWILHGNSRNLPTRDAARESTFSVCSVSAIWELDGLGIAPEPEESSIVPRPRWNEEEGKIETGLLWKSDERPVNNFGPAAKRVEKMLSRLDVNQRQLYDDFMATKKKEGIIALSPLEWSLLYNQFLFPHRGIYEGKFRPVFDGSARDGVGRPLNSYLEAGPNLLPKLLDVLLRFRVQKVGMQADVKAAFHQILLPESDRPFVQFVFANEVYHFRFCPFGCICSPSMYHASVDFLLGRAAELPSFNTAVVNALRAGLYFDDAACGFNSIADAKFGAQEAVRIFESGGMVLHKIRISGEDLPPAKLLGLTWNTVEDSLSVHIPPPTNIVSKKDLLSYISRIWDPLGLLSPWVIKGKILFQSTWENKPKWDDPLPVATKDEVNTWLSSVVDNASFMIPRLCSLPPFSIECYVDASSKACCAAVYLVDACQNRQLLLSKSRLAPLRQKLSIPRLELVAALIGVRLVRSVTAALENIVSPSAVFYFSDSQDVLFWLQQRRAQKVFVANRVKEILSLSTVHQWFYVPTSSNVADLGTRGVSLSTLASSHAWWSGPALSHVSQPFTAVEPSPAAMREDLSPDCVALPVSAEAFVVRDARFPLIESARCFRLLVGATAWMLRFIRNCRLPAADRNLSQTISPEEIAGAKVFWLKEEQSRYFLPDDVRKRYRDYKPKEHEDGVFYITPRTGERPAAILPPDSRLTELIVADAHRRMFHQGASATSSFLVSHYHVPRRLVKKIISKCIPCRRFRSLPYQAPEAELPAVRSEMTRCFARIGIDFFGPFIVDEDDDSRKKAYCLIFACYSSRAIHLEAVKSQSTLDTAAALRRFIALRGEPVEIMSDNAKAYRCLQKIVPPTIAWKTIPERSPWWGGHYERLIGIVKKSLRISLHNQRFSFDQLALTLYELAFFVNLRPLMKTGDEILSPACFVYNVSSMEAVLCPDIVSSPSVHWQLRKQASLALRRRFLKEYVTSLRPWRQRVRSADNPPKPGDVVLVHDEGPRATWHYGLVEELIPGRDGAIRAAHVKIKGVSTRRAVQRLYELHSP